MTDDAFDVPDEGSPDVEPDVTVVDVRGDKQIAFRGLDQLHIPEEKRDDIHDIYSDIIIEFDEIKDEYVGPDRAWHLGRVMSEHGVKNHEQMTLEELGAFNTIDDMYARRLFYARHIYAFWPEQGYDPRHSITALGELASRALNSERVEQTHDGYARILNADEDLSKPDVLAWSRTPQNPTLDDIVKEVSQVHSKPSRMVEAVKRSLLLLDRPLSSVSGEELKEKIKKYAL